MADIKCDKPCCDITVIVTRVTKDWRNNQIT